MIKQKKISEAIYVYENAMSDELCDGIWDFYYKNIDKASVGRTSGGLFPDTKKTFDFNDTENKFTVEEKAQYADFDHQIYHAIKEPVSMYIETYGWLKTCDNLVDTGYLWQGYKKSEGFYKEHIDGEVWTKNVSNRVLAIIAYINTIEEGGETYFRHQDVYVKPVKGSVAIFPTHWAYPHQAMVPLSSDKLILSSFVITPQGE
jgi:hypothetical protein